MTEREKMLKGELYNSFDPELVEMRKEARLLTESTITPLLKMQKSVKRF